MYVPHNSSQALGPIVEARGERLRKDLRAALGPPCRYAASLVRRARGSSTIESFLIVYYLTQAANAAIEISDKFAAMMYWSTYRGSKY